MLAVAGVTALVTETNLLDPEYQRVKFEYRPMITFARHERWVHEMIVLSHLFQKLSFCGKDKTGGRIVICAIGMIIVAAAYRIEIVPLKVLVSSASGRSRIGIKIFRSGFQPSLFENKKKELQLQHFLESNNNKRTTLKGKLGLDSRYCIAYCMVCIL